VEVCRPDGLGWDFVERCASAALCANDRVSQTASCLAAACAPGESRCAEDGTRSVCNAQRTAFVSCASGDALCSGLGAVCSPSDGPLGDPPLDAPPGGAPLDEPSGAAGDAVVPPEAPRCVFGPFAQLERLTNDPNGNYWSPAMSSDSLTLFFGGSRADDPEHIFSTARANPSAAFVTVSLTAGVNSNASEGTPTESFDGLTLYFYSTRPGGPGDRDLWSATRPDRSSNFARPAPVAAINGPGVDHLPWLSRDELTLIFSSIRPGGEGDADLWVSRREARDQDFAPPLPLEGVNSASYEGRSTLSSNQLGIIFASTRDGGRGGFDLWTATRGSVDEPFGDVENLGELNAESSEFDPFLSEDGRELLFISDRRGRAEIWRATRPCE
jgi:Tol biopolymer transport system component